ncbi:unnamed protein product [Cunninghamella echinulata]
MAFSASVATFLTFAAFILELFTLIGNTYNQPFLRDLYFTRLVSGDQFITFGLWSYCEGSNWVVDTCSKPVGGFVWTKADIIQQWVDGFHGQDQLFLANFILYWIAFGLTFLALIITVLSQFKRSSDVVASLACFLASIVLLVVFIFLMVLSLRGINEVKQIDSSISGHLGPSMWMTLGALVGALLASLWYCIACCCGSGRVKDNTIKA